MKLKYLMTLITTASLFLAGCAYDNFEAPASNLSGRVVYNGNALSVRNNGVRLFLWQNGYPLKDRIEVFLNQEGNFSSSLFPGQYKLVRVEDSPWQQQMADTILVDLKGDVNIDVPVTPYFTISDASIQKSGTMISAQLVVNKVVQSANVDRVRLYLGKSILTDDVRNELSIDGNVGSLVLGQPMTLSGALPDNLKNLDYVFARIGVKSTSSGEYIYTQVQKIALK